MKLTMGEVVGINATIEEITKRSNTEEGRLPGHLAIKLAMLAKDISTPWAEFDKQRNELVQRLGTPDENNQGMMLIKNENIGEFNAEIGKMLSIEVLLTPSFAGLSDADLDLLKISVSEAYTLLPFLKEKDGSDDKAGV